MKHFTTTLLMIAALFTASSSLFAQDASTQGTEFWVSFMSNGHKYHTSAPNNGNWILTQVLISGKRDCTGTITNPQTGWSHDFTVRANNITTIEIPENVAYVDGLSEQVVNKGLQIISDDTISVFCTNIAHLSFDASYVLPTQSLADDYLIQTDNQSSGATSLPYVKENETSAFLIIATEDGTTVDITPSVDTYNGRTAGYEFSVNLNKGQVYQVRSTKSDGRRDLSGSKVTARDCKRIAVFNGNNLTAIPRNGGSYDHIFEQAMPLQAWGKSFVVTSSLERETDYVKITSAADNNEIRKNGEFIATLELGQSYIFEMRTSEKSCFIESTGRSAVYLYNTSRGGNSIGDPSVVWIAPIEQRIDDITFSTFHDPNYASIDNHHVNIIVNSEDAGTVTLDGRLIPANDFVPVNGSNAFVYTRKNIDHGVHRIQCPNGFNAHVYGFGIAKGYAYLVGSKTADLTTKVDINGQLVNHGDTISHCQAETVTFNAVVNLSSYDLKWDFGDGTSSTENPVVHTYDDPSLYTASLIITTDEIGGCMFSTSDTSHYYIDARVHYEYDEAELCKGDTYTEYGFNVVITNDTILKKAIDIPEHPLCKDSLFVYITALPGYYAAYTDTLCWQGDPITYTDYGFNIPIDHPDTYTDQIVVPIPGGCDSIIDLTLTVTERIISPFQVEYVGCAASYSWNGVTYTESGNYEQVFTSTMGCDSIVMLHIVLDETVEGDTDTVTGLCTAYEWHGHLYDQSGYYTDTIPNIFGCDSIVHLELDIVSGSSPSEILPVDTQNETPHWVISASEYEINYYDFTIESDSSGITWDSVQWNLECGCNWEIMPFGDGDQSCRVVVLERVEDTVWLTATVFDPCHPSEGIERRYWLMCSFYGIDDNAGSGSVDFSVIPNPNHGEMNIITHNMAGEIGVKVYNMTGLLVDQFILTATHENHHPYTLNNYPSGIYLMVFSQQEGFVTKKVVITK